jgi:hypothetical protein
MEDKMRSRSLSIVQKHFPNVVRVKEAKANVVVEVGKKDVTESKRKDHEGCAMAVACKRKFKLDGVLIATSSAYLIKGETATRFRVPPSVAREVVSFDRGAGFEEGTYRLSKPCNPPDSGGTPNRANEGKGKAKGQLHKTTNVRAILGSENER